jgi:hypothetical protein
VVAKFTTITFDLLVLTFNNILFLSFFLKLNSMLFIIGNIKQYGTGNLQEKNIFVHVPKKRLPCDPLSPPLEAGELVV